MGEWARFQGRQPAKESPSYDIRCLHIDYTRPSNSGGEFKWRCPAIFPYDGVHAFCPAHRTLYKGPDDGHLASREDAHKAIDTVEQFAVQHRMPDAASDEGSREAAVREQRELRAKAVTREEQINS